MFWQQKIGLYNSNLRPMIPEAEVLETIAIFGLPCNKAFSSPVSIGQQYEINMKSKAVLPTDQHRICCTILNKLSKDNLFVCDGFNETKKMSSQWLLYHKWNIENSVFVTSHFGRFENDTSLCVYFVLKIRFLTQFMLHACNYRHAISELQTHETSFGDLAIYDDVIKLKHFPRYWPFVREIHRSPVNSPHKVQYRGALMFSLICARINGWVNNRGWWFETPSRPLWRHCNDVVQYLQ